jgi:hypothetical protein
MSFAMDLLFLPCLVAPTFQSQTHKKFYFERATLKPLIQDGEETQSIAESWSASWGAYKQTQEDVLRQQRLKETFGLWFGSWYISSPVTSGRGNVDT